MTASEGLHWIRQLRADGDSLAQATKRLVILLNECDQRLMRCIGEMQVNQPREDLRELVQNCKKILAERNDILCVCVLPDLCVFARWDGRPRPMAIERVVASPLVVGAVGADLFDLSGHALK